MVKIMENPIKMDDLGIPLFLETPIYKKTLFVGNVSYKVLCWGCISKEHICLVAFNQTLVGDFVLGVKLRFPRFELLLEWISIVFVGVGISNKLKPL